MSALVNGAPTGPPPEIKPSVKNGTFANIRTPDKIDQISKGSNNNKLPKRSNSSALESSQDVLLADKSTSIAMNGDASIIAEDSILCNDVSNSIILDDSVSVVPNADMYVPGQLMWARIGSYPYWPCIITLDPDDNMHIQPANRAGFKVHINYFADNGRHGWVGHRNMMLFEGKEKFLAMSKEDPKRNLKGFVVKSAFQERWNKAVEEASPYLDMAIEDRLEIFHKEVKALLENLVKAKKRKMSNEESDQDAKKMKLAELDDFNFVTPDLNKTGNQSGSQSRMEIGGSGPLDVKEAPKRRRSESVLGDRMEDMKRIIGLSDKTVLPFERMTRSESRMGERILDMDKIFEEESGAKRMKRSDSRIADKIVKTVKPNGVLSKNKSVKESGSSSEDEVEEEVKEEKQIQSKRLNLFRDVKKERVCQLCEKTGALVRCKGPCLSYFHLACAKPEETSSETETDEEENDPSGILEDLKIIRRETPEEQEKVNGNGSVTGKDKEFIKCIDCLSGVPTACFVCHEREGDRIKCSTTGCGKYYHQECLKLWPQAHWQGGRLTCPLHVCQTCVSDNPQNSHLHQSSYDSKLVKCVRCPSAYHQTQHCVPAGTTILTTLQIICPKHFKTTQPPINTTWCFLCTEGGSLICCDTCPMSFHAECLSIKAPDGAYICEDCESGRLPLYGEIVWAKLGSYRWWPAVVCYPDEIPFNVARLPHSHGEFCVMFFGSNDYYWVHRGRVFLYQDGDAQGKVSTATNKTNKTYRIALDVAQEAHTRFKAERELRKSIVQTLKPPRYVKLKSNKPFGNVKVPELDSIVACNCNPNAEMPCAPDSECVNRMLFFECSTEICPAGIRCQNQDFQKCNYPTMKPFHTESRGWGLRALEKIMQGRFVIEYVGEIIDEAEYKRRLKCKKETKNENFYFLTIDNNRMIDAEPKGNLSRFMNHSCQPNCETQKWTVNGDTRIGLFALKNIEPGEELTFNYQLQSDGEQKKPCLCGAPNCSGFIGLKANKIDVIKDFKPRGRKAICYMCGFQIDNNEEILRCNDHMCIKKYHKSCIKSKSPANFVCPVHTCGECNRPSSKRCNMCCKAWCKVHFTAVKMSLHKELHDDIYADSESTISRADSNNLDNPVLDSTIEEVSIINCSTPIPKSKNMSFAKKSTTRKENSRNSKTPLRLENSTGNSQPSKKTDEKKATSPEVEIIAVKKVDKKLTPIAKKPSMNSDTENQTPPKLIVDVTLFRPKSKNKNKKLKDGKKNRAEEINENIELGMFFDVSSIDNEMSCRVCQKSKNLIQCNGPCGKFFHETCTSSKLRRRNGQRSITNDNPNAFKCSDCLSQPTPCCNSCDKSTQPVINCSVYKCNNYYHPSCLQSWPQAQTLRGKSICPQHVCHTCAANDISAEKQLKVSFEKMHKCIRCFTAYHSYAYCIPAGSIIVSANSIICPRHYPQNTPENFSWCFQCAKNEVDLECTECPVSYHKRCIPDGETTSPFVCKKCKSGKLPLHNEVVWVKANFSFECWPAVICTNENIPPNLLEKKLHPGEMCVLFLEVNKYEYVSKERIIQFDGEFEIVKMRFENSPNSTDDAFAKALANAQSLYKQFEMVRIRSIHSLPELPDPTYKHIDINIQSKKTLIELKYKVPICKCDPDLENPCGSNCINRLAKIECNVSTCPAGDKCTNQVMTKQLNIATERFCTSDRGWGLRTLEPINKGDLVIEYVGESLQKKSLKKRLLKASSEDRHIFYVQQSGNRYFDSKQKGNLSRFINHSCEPNCQVEQWIAEGYQRVGIFAIRNVEVGEELTICYEVVEFKTKIPCLCGSANCTGIVGFTKEQTLLEDSVTLGDSIDDTLGDSSLDLSKTRDEKSQTMTNLIVEYKCWKCNESFTDEGNVHKCDVCDNKYHKTCIDEDEKKLITCPWHFCQVCKNNASWQCHLCCNAYCSDHSTNNLTLMDDKRYECKKHIKKIKSSANVSSRTRKKDRRTI